MGEEGHSSQDELLLSQESFAHFWQDNVAGTDLHRIADGSIALSDTEPMLPPTDLTFDNPADDGTFLPITDVVTPPLIQLDLLPENDQPPTSQQQPQTQTYIHTLTDLDLATIAVPEQPILVCSSSAFTASLPATSNWAGLYGFSMSFPEVDPLTKKAEYMFSPQTNKVYVKKDAVCPIIFSTTHYMTPAFTIRAMAVYTNPDHAARSVNRCFTHSTKDKANGIAEHEHLIRCESSQSVYDKDATTKRCSVIVPYENPRDGETGSTYCFKFACWGSCVGGLNRKAIIVVFSLEYGGLVIGRRAVEVRICACPSRDRRSDEKKLEPRISPNIDIRKRPKECADEEYSGSNKKLKFNPVTQDPPGMSSCRSSVPKSKCSPYTQDPSITIRVKDQNLCIFLRQMKKVFEVSNTIQRFAPQFEQFLRNSGSRNFEIKSSEESN